MTERQSPISSSSRELEQKQEQLEKLLKVELDMERTLPTAAQQAVSATHVHVNMLVAPTTRHAKAAAAAAAGVTSSTRRLVSSSTKTLLLKKKKRKIAPAHPPLEEEDDDDESSLVDSVYWLRTTPASKDSSALLTRQEEVLLTSRIRSLRAAEEVRDGYLATLCCGDDLCISEFKEDHWATACGFASPQELRKVIRQGQQARSHLVQANIGLVVSIAKKHHASLKQALEAGNGVGTTLTLQDCLQEGQIGLIKAAERFDPARNVRFSTYATWWIRQRICGAIQDTSRIIRLPAHGEFCLDFLFGMLQVMVFCVADCGFSISPSVFIPFPLLQCILC
jgi:DNA-directed RNA polymerase sigma subunit (sigma70/sigma32)